MYPHYVDAVSRNQIHLNDYKSLAPRRFITNYVVDFKLRMFQSSGPTGQSVWVLSNILGQQLTSGFWWNVPRLVEQLEQARLWQDGGVRLVVVPVCESHHYFVLVAVLDHVPKFYILESVGGYDEPSQARLLREFLLEQRQLVKNITGEFMTVKPLVPLQGVGTNNCAVYIIAFIEKIVQNPGQFVELAERNQLVELLHIDGDKRREDLAMELAELTVNQRKDGEILNGKEAVELPDLGYSQVVIEITG